MDGDGACGVGLGDVFGYADIVGADVGGAELTAFIGADSGKHADGNVGDELGVVFEGGV